MRLMVNSWFPAWLDGTKPRTYKRLLVDSIRYSR